MKKVALLLFLIITKEAISQNTIGLPDIINYSKQQYQAGAQNRQVRQDKKGVLYFANSEGMLSFDGINWKTYPISNNSIVRCVEFGPDNKLYVGGQDEFGYFSPGENGQLKYHSLKQLLPRDERSFTDVWEIYFYKDAAFFQTSNKIYQISGNHCNVYKSTHWKFISLCNNRLIAQDYDKGLLQFNNGLWEPFLKSSELPANYFVTSLSEIGHDSAILTTIKDGAYILHGDEVIKIRSALMDQISPMHISASQLVSDHQIALTTNLDGCYIIDPRGNLIQKFSHNEGLQNNNILDIFLDKEKNIWLGLDNGIDFIAYNNAIKHINPDYLNAGSGYTASIFHNELYIGTSNGLYKTTLQEEKDLSFIKGNFECINNSKGQVWNLSKVNNSLLMGHHDGAFLVEGNTAKLIDNSSGYWTFFPYSNILPSSSMIAGTYQGINFYIYKEGKFQKNDSLYAYFESARFICVDNDKIWATHPYKGVFRVELHSNSPVVKSYGQKEGIISPNGNYVFKIRDRIILTTENGIFEYNEQKDQFEPSAFYNDLFTAKKIRYLKEDNAGNVWFVFDKVIGVVDMSSPQRPQLIYFPELTNKFVSGFEFIYPIDKNNVLIGGEKGFFHINYEQYRQIRYALQVEITSVKAINGKDSLLFGGYTAEVNEEQKPARGKYKIGHSWNSFHFEYAAPVFAQQANIQYSYFLEGFDEKWSEFTQKTEKEYTNLPAGNYTFKVKARNNLGNQSAVGEYCFTILPPWYQTYWAYGLYLLIFVVGNYMLYVYLKRKFRAQQTRNEEEQKRLKYLHLLEMDKSEREIIKLKNEKLEVEIENKNTELASVAMHLVQKGELIGKIKDQMVRIKNIKGEKDTDDFKKIIRIISEEDMVDKQWEKFTMHFDHIHRDFLFILKSKYPTLTSNELKLSAYLRVNLSTKEIAQLMNISVRGVEISRYRLRKKLQIATEVNLFDFLMGLTLDTPRLPTLH